MHKIFSLVTTLLLLTGCVHKIDIQQGNVIEQDKVNKLHIGMSKGEVEALMGTPILINTFNDNRVDYIYTMKHGSEARTEKSVILIFQENRLRNISEQNR
jgi:outer membrane protein assembly factor BamE